MFLARFQPFAHRLAVEFLRIDYNGNNDGCASTLESWLSTKRNVNETQRRGSDGKVYQPGLVGATGASQMTNVTSDVPEPEQEDQPARTNDLAENLRQNNGTSAEDSAQKTETTALAATEAQFHYCSPASFRIICRTALR